jgi:hypothetical protein
MHEYNIALKGIGRTNEHQNCFPFRSVLHFEYGARYLFQLKPNLTGTNRLKKEAKENRKHFSEIRFCQRLIVHPVMFQLYSYFNFFPRIFLLRNRIILRRN